jgi:hypothetical protein
LCEALFELIDLPPIEYLGLDSCKYTWWNAFEMEIEPMIDECAGKDTITLEEADWYRTWTSAPNIPVCTWYRSLNLIWFTYFFYKKSRGKEQNGMNRLLLWVISSRFSNCFVTMQLDNW